MAILIAEALGAILLAGAGVAIGRAFGRMRSRCWLLGYVFPLAIVIGIGIARHVETLCYVEPFSWIAMGRRPFLLIAFCCAVLFMTLSPRLNAERKRRAVAAFATLAVGYAGILPVLVPAITAPGFRRMETRIDPSGVCLQSRSYTCGPAAAVTALRAIGIAAEEGEMAIRARTSFIIGTPPNLLCAALDDRLAGKGLRAEFRVFEGIDRLRESLPAIAAVKHGFLVDHYVAVLDIGNEEVVVGDPLRGRVSLPREAFRALWRAAAIVFAAR
ncbi:MAG: hypothetical protein JXP34_17495 [Planctomycetes bacterium]|nr:hypothetical protein [Planctomycetota bacterium]